MNNETRIRGSVDQSNMSNSEKKKDGPGKRSRDAVKHNVFTFGGSGKVGGGVAEDRSGNDIAAVGKTSSKELHVKQVALTEKDDVEAYLVTFECIMQAYKVDKAYWTYHLAPQLSEH